MKEHYHLVGIGGVSMSAIAFYLKSQSFEVSGSDLVESPRTTKLEKAGIKVFIGHNINNVSEDIGGVIYTSAVASGPGRVELKAASRMGIKIIRRADFLGELFNQKQLICISGAHGKSTISAMITKVLSDNNLSPTAFLGANYKDFTFGNYQKGNDELIVIEACEYDRSFLSFKPDIAIITNIDAEHLDYFKNGIDEIILAFADFIRKIKTNGYLVYWKKDSYVQRAIRLAGRGEINYVSYAQDINGDIVTELKLKIPGEFNIDNALAAFSVSRILKIPKNKIIKSLNQFTGIERRLELKFESKNLLIFDDYGHHPTEISKTLQALKEKYPERRVVVIFQPHQYSRTKLLFDKFKSCFTSADLIVVAPVFEVAGREENREIGSELLAKAITNPPALYLPTFKKIADHIFDNLENGDIVVTIGAGTIYQVGEMIIEKIKAKK